MNLAVIEHPRDQSFDQWFEIIHRKNIWYTRAMDDFTSRGVHSFSIATLDTVEVSLHSSTSSSRLFLEDKLSWVPTAGLQP